MTIRKYNKIKKLCQISASDRLFCNLLAEVERFFNTDNLTSQQIAMIIEFAYHQHNDGYMKAFDELRR